MSRIDDLIEQIRGLEAEVQGEFDKKRDDFRFTVEKKRFLFSEDVTALQRGSKVGLLRYLRQARLLSYVVAPVIYVGFIPMLLLDLFLGVHQAVCFPVYGITKVRRSNYVILDRADLPYLNTIEQFNCFYCGYANGLMSYAKEVAARTEQFFCPIKHARRIIAAHDQYATFFEYGDAESYRRGLERLRDRLGEASDEQ
jgi:hypothetical protein